MLWLGTAERISAMVEMNHPGVWVMGDLADDDRRHGMGIVVEYAGQTRQAAMGQTESRFAGTTRVSAGQTPRRHTDETIEMTIVKNNAALDGFNQWTLNGEAFSMESMKPHIHVHAGAPLSPEVPQRQRRYSSVTFAPPQLRIDPDRRESRRGGHQGCRDARAASRNSTFDFVADNPGPTLFHCHQQLHMDFGFMALFRYA